MNLRANRRILALDASLTILSIAACAYYIITGQFYAAGICTLLFIMAFRHLLNDWQALQITQLQLSLRATRHSWHIDAIVLCLLLIAMINGVLQADTSILLALTLAGLVLTLRHCINGYESLHKPRPAPQDEHTAVNNKTNESKQN